MTRNRIISICLLTFVLAVTGVALAQAVKVELAPYQGLEPEASGHAILNYDMDCDMTQIQINCWDLTPMTEYTVYLNDGSWYSIGTFITRKNGTGNLHVSLEGDVSGHLPVAVNNPSNQTVLLGQ